MCEAVQYSPRQSELSFFDDFPSFTKILAQADDPECI